MGKIGHKSFTFVYKLVNRADNSVVFAKGESVQVCFDYRQNEPIPVFGGLREKLEGFMGDEGSD